MGGPGAAEIAGDEDRARTETPAIGGGRAAQVRQGGGPWRHRRVVPAGPPSLVATAVVPTARQSDVVGQDRLESLFPAGIVSAVQLLPPSVVRTMVAALATDTPTAQQSEAVAHETAIRF